jgi:23S rRNA (pseudouridine1915-N3)-methyltransferase
MKIRLITVGRDRSGPLLEAAREFEARLRRYTDFEALELKEAPLKRNRAPAAVRTEEADRIRAARAPGAYAVAFDQRGRARSSEDWAASLERWQLEGRRAVDFWIGGPVGLDSALCREADEVWSLGPLTLPHRLARVVALEQIYRAFTILNREPYHK